MKTYQKTREKHNEDTDDLPGYPEYEKEDDIYNKAKEEDEIDPENIYSRKESNFEDTSLADDLDIPGSELDDDSEETGNEDEENNYYSLSDNDDLEDLI
ncbi:MAG TPA: hypothetical protein VHO46_01080 [Bacteroidales bacterium]|nr:hypothetical protein [Bacteroidales bacterium]